MARKIILSAGTIILFAILSNNIFAQAPGQSQQVSLTVKDSALDKPTKSYFNRMR